MLIHKKLCQPNCLVLFVLSIVKHCLTPQRCHPSHVCLQAPYDLEPAEWADRAEKSSACSLLFDTDSLLQKFLVFKEKLSKRFKRSKDSVLDEVVPEIRDDCKPGDEMTQELTDAWTLYTRVTHSLSSLHTGSWIVIFLLKDR